MDLVTLLMYTAGHVVPTIGGVGSNVGSGAAARVARLHDPDCRLDDRSHRFGSRSRKVREKGRDSRISFIYVHWRSG